MRRHNWLLPVTIAIGIALRLLLRSHCALWEDELIAVTQGVQPFLQVIVTTAMNDIHPPLYFLQLHFWSLFGTSDRWFIVNSILYSLAALASLFFVVRRSGGKELALAATAVMAVLPSALWMGEEVRMYAWLSLLLIWMLHFVTRAFVEPDPRKRDYAAILALAFAITYSHAIGFIAVLFFGLYAVSFLLTRRAAWREWLVWAIVFGGAGLMILPMMASDLLHPADMPAPAGIGSMIEWLASVVTGSGAAQNFALFSAGAIAYLAIVVAGTANSRTRRMTLCFLVGPMALCIATSLVIRPLFKTNFFSTFLSPFLAIVVAQLLIQIPVKSRNLATACVLAGFIVLAVCNRRDLNTGSDYFLQTAHEIETAEHAGDIVWVPQTDIFWGMAHYLIGPNWGSPLAIAPPLRAGSHWHELFAWLGPNLENRLHVLPVAQSIITTKGIPIVVGANSDDQLKSASRIWLVTFGPRDDLPASLPGQTLGILHLSRTIAYLPLTISLYE